jgi:hypothetical protein
LPRKGFPMFKLPIRTWVNNAAAVFSGQHGAVTEQAQESGCSRETVYQHARKVEERLDQASRDESRLATQDAEIARLQQKVAELAGAAQLPTTLDPLKQRQFATTACAMGLSLRQTQDLFRVLLPPGEAPGHATIGRWVESQAKRARQVLDVLDPACTTRVETLAIDEIFFGGDRPWSASNRRA